MVRLGRRETDKENLSPCFDVVVIVLTAKDGIVRVVGADLITRYAIAGRQRWGSERTKFSQIEQNFTEQTFASGVASRSLTPIESAD